jgi:S1-C subfamily serine protease
MILIKSRFQPQSNRENSGGPVLDASGYLIGIVVSRLNAVRGGLPQNVNFAIKASTAANFLDAHGIAYRSATGESVVPIQISLSRRETSPFRSCVRTSAGEPGHFQDTA